MTSKNVADLRLLYHYAKADAQKAKDEQSILIANATLTGIVLSCKVLGVELNGCNSNSI